MPRGLPDYYNPDTLVAQRLTNLNDLLTSILKVTPVDNRGRMYFIDTFGEGGSGWEFLSSGDATDPTVTTALAMIAPASVKMPSGTSGGSGITQLLKSFLYLANANAGLEVGWFYRSDVPRFRMRMQWNTATALYNASLRLDPSDGGVDILNNAGAWEEVADLAAGPANGNWIPVKLVADFSNFTYLRAILGSTEVDLSSYDLRTVAAGSTGSFDTSIFGEGIDASARTGYVGYTIVTVDEP